VLEPAKVTCQVAVKKGGRSEGKGTAGNTTSKTVDNVKNIRSI
jgi:hypothetical protein